MITLDPPTVSQLTGIPLNSLNFVGRQPVAGGTIFRYSTSDPYYFEPNGQRGWDSGIAYYDPTTGTGYTINQYNAVTQRAYALDPTGSNPSAAFAQATEDILRPSNPSSGSGGSPLLFLGLALLVLAVVFLR